MKGFKWLGKNFALYTSLTIWAFIQVYPIFLMFLSSFKSTREILVTPWALPSLSNIALQNYVGAWVGAYQGVAVGIFLINSLIVALSSVTITVILATIAGYALARYVARGLSIIFYLFLTLIAVPGQSVFIPLYFQMRDLQLLNNYLGLILPYTGFTLPFSIIIARAYFKTFPREVEEAARIDGASEWKLLSRIVLPMSRPILATLAIVNFPGYWNELLFSLVIMTDNDKKTLPVGIIMFRGEHAVQWGLMFAGMCISTIPLVIFYLLFQKQIIRGIALGAVKG